MGLDVPGMFGVCEVDAEAGDLFEQKCDGGPMAHATCVTCMD